MSSTGHTAGFLDPTDVDGSQQQRRPQKKTTLLLEEGRMAPNDEKVLGEEGSSGASGSGEGDVKTGLTQSDGEDAPTFRRRSLLHDQSTASQGGLGGPAMGPPRRMTTVNSTSMEGRNPLRSFTSLFQPEHGLKPAPTIKQSLINVITYTWLNVLLICIPVSWALYFALDRDDPKSSLAIFLTSFIAIMPLAGLLSYGTEEVALRVGQTLGGLINATLGNAVELIVAIIALVHCELVITQTSLVGSVLSNLLLVLGMCCE